MTTLLKDLIDIPERAGAEDYVLRLTDSVGEDRVHRTLDAYVVTPDIADSFDTALGLVADAVGNGVSRGAFLTGSFGSGKSHFMAVLHALLRHEPYARSKAELQSVIARHDGALQGKTFLPLAFHLLGAETLERAVFDGYLRQIRELHPDAPLPALHRSDALLRDAAGLRERLGDDKFFEGLNGGAEAHDDVWSGILGAGTWDAQTYRAAEAANPAAEDRQQLVSALVENYFQAYTQQARYVDLDTGLAAISAHADRLGYDAVVLFLDELVLWLAFGVQDREFFRRESQKITKLVESSVGHRPVPLISFVARQLDLRQWFADAGASGAEQDALDRAFKHQQGRFATIELGDDNLPHVAQQRLLTPRDDEARQSLEESFRGLDRRPAVWDVLLDGVNTDDAHRGADEAAFRQTYPFSPALVSTLRSLASVMQRERTALKVMQQMLVDQRDELTAADVIPVGDAFDYVVQGHSGQALDQKVAALFRAANTLYAEKLRPVLLAKYDLSEADVAAGKERPPGLLADERLAQTLLMSAVAPNVPALKGLTPSRLAALNHGSIVSPLPGNEATMVAAKVREWARHVPEIHIENEARNPIIRVELSDVDYESIVEKARGEDNEGRRRELIKELVIESLGVNLGSEDVRGARPYQIVWRGSRRDVDLVFGNVRDSSWLPEDAFTARPGTWRVVVDHPFDEAGHTSAEDLQRLESMMAGDFRSQTIVWLPRFFAEDRMRDVRRLVILNWLLEGSGERWSRHADHLSETDRVQARAILESQRATLRHSLLRAIQEAYDAAAPSGTDVVEDAAHERVLTSMDSAFQPQRPVGATLAAAFDNLLRQAFDATYPGHPVFDPADTEIRVRDLKAVAEHVERAMTDQAHRVPLQGDIAAVRRVANTLGVGQAAETHFILSDDRFEPWATQFARELGRRGDQHAPVTVREMRSWIDAMVPAKGLRDEVADLVVLTWAALRLRAWYNFGAAIPTPAPGSLRPEMEMREQALPESAAWDRAVARAGEVFGVAANPHLTPQAVAELSQAVRRQVTDLHGPAATLLSALRESYPRVSLDPDGAAPRLATARTATHLCDQLRHLDGVDLANRLAADDHVTDAALGRSLRSAAAVADGLRQFAWDRLAPLRQAAAGEGARADEAAHILETLRQQLEADELSALIGAAMRNTDERLYAWLAAAQPTPKPTPPKPPTGSPSPAGGARRGGRRLAAGDPVDQVLGDLDRFRQQHADVEVEVEWRIVE
ncbi:DUF6079 family protein [Propionibacteriaceae bacterium Y2011]